MSSARSQRLRGSLGDSWGDAEYESSEDASMQSASEFGSERLSESDMEDGDIDATPVATRARIAPTKARQSPQFTTPVKTRPLRSSRGNTPAEPSLIMPSLHHSPSLHTSAMRTSTMRIRPRPRQPRSQTNGAKHSQLESRRTSTGVSSNHRNIAKTDSESPSYLLVFWERVIWPTLRYLQGVVTMAMGYLQPLFSVALAILVIATFIGNASNFLQYGIQKALSPICHVPFSSYVVPFCAQSGYQHQGEASELDFEKLMRIQSNFEDILSENQNSQILPYTMKRSEAAIRDLRTVVRYSRLPSKNELEVEFDAFVDAARQASLDLIGYNSRINGAVDRVISTNKWTMQVLRGLSAKEDGIGMLERVFTSINPMSAFSARPLTLQQAVFEQYLKHASANKDEIDRLIESGTALQSLLTSLDDRLGTIRNIAARDDDKVSQNRDELLAQLWTKLGGNSASRKNYEKQLSLLNNVRLQHNEAFRHVTGVLLKLQTISAGLGDLRDTVAEPLVLGYRSEMPIERYLELVDQSTIRLQDVRGQTSRIEKGTYGAAMGREELDTDKALPGGKEGPVVYAKNKDGRKN